MGRKGLNWIVTKFQNVIKMGVLESERDLSLSIIRDGQNNDWPDFLRNAVYESPTATACTDRVKDFIQGRDLHEDLKNLVINEEGQTFLDLHEAVCMDFAIFERFGIKINPRANNSIESLYHIPLEWIRYKDNEKYDNPIYNYAKVNAYLNTGQEYWAKSKTYPLFTSLDNIRSEAAEIDNYYGHLIYYNPTNYANRIYSRPKYSSAIRAILTDARQWEYHERDTKNNFFLGGILTRVGDPDKGIGDVDSNGVHYTTVGEEFNDEMADLFGGTENAGNIITMWKAHPDDPDPNIIPWPAGETDKKFVVLDPKIVQVICMVTSVPQVLLPIPRPNGWGDNNLIRNAIKFLNNKTETKRLKIEEIYRKFLPGLGVNIPENESIIKPIADITDLPEYVFNAMSSGQRRDYMEQNFGVEPVEEEEESDIIEELILNGNGSNNPNNNN